MAKTIDAWIGQKLRKPLPLNRSDILHYQLTKLKRVVAYAREQSSFYQQHLQGEKFENLAEFQRLPLTNEKQLEEKGHKWLCTSQSEIARIVTLQTSGTTGAPKRIFFTEADQELTLDYFHNGLQLPFRASEKILVLLPCAKPGSVGALVCAALARFGGIGIAYGLLDSFASVAAVLQEQTVHGVVAPPVHLLALGEFLCKQGINYPLRTALVSSDALPLAVMQRIKTIFGCEVFNHYGTTEMGLGCALDCSLHQGMHIRENDLFLEIVDQQTGIALTEGHWGEVVVTTLTRTGMPLLRYKTGDIARLIPENCPCGSRLRRLDKPKGRKNDIKIDEEHWLLAKLDELLFSHPQIVDYAFYREPQPRIIVQSFDNKLDIDQVRAILMRDKLIRRYFGIKIKVELELNIVQEWKPLHQGKRKIY